MANTDTRFPGVYTQLVDTSFGIPSSGVSTAFIAFLSEKGRDNQLISIGSTDELLTNFGSIDSGKHGQGMLVLSNWFSAASSAYCVRVMPDSTNVPAMTHSYVGIYGNYSNSKMTMIEAGYANLCFIVNKGGGIELRRIAPKYYGSIKNLNVQNQKDIIADASVGDRYAISYAGKSTAGSKDVELEYNAENPNAVFASVSSDPVVAANTFNTIKNYWVGKDGKIATVKGIYKKNTDPNADEEHYGVPQNINWSYEDMDTIGYCKAYNRNYYLVNYTRTTGTYTTSWEEIEPEFDRFDAVSVADILNEPPELGEGETYNFGESYLIAAPTNANLNNDWKNKPGKVATYTGIDDVIGEEDLHKGGWVFSVPDKVVVENDGFVFYDSPKNFNHKTNTYNITRVDGKNVVDSTGNASHITVQAPKETFKNTRIIVSSDIKLVDKDGNPESLGTAWYFNYYIWENNQAVSKTFSAAGKIAYVETITEDNNTRYEWRFFTPYASAYTDSYVKETIVMARTTYATDGTSTFFNYYCFGKRPDYRVVQYWTRNPDVLFPAYLKRTSEMDSILSTSRPDNYTKTKAGEYLFILYAIGRGTYYNNIQVSMALSSKTQLEDDDYERTMILDIYDTNSGSKVLLESFEVSFNPEAKDPVTDTPLFICNVLENYSNILRCKSVDPTYLKKDYTYMNNINTNVDNLFREYERYNTVGTTKLSPALGGGYNGNLYNGNGTVNWNVAKNLLAKAYTGLLINPNSKDDSDFYLTDVLDTEMVLIDIVLDAGYPKEVKVAINDMITARSNDCIGIIDQLDNVSSEMAFKARTDSNGITKQFNTPYIAIYEPYSEIYDKYTGNNLWVTPVYHAARAFAITDRDYGKHYAPAGANRGLCSGINKLRYNLYKDNSYKEKFVAYCINPIICNRLGYLIYGQSTSYLKQTKLQDINVIRTILEIERDLKLQLGTILFDLNDSNTLMTIDSAVRAYLGNKMANGVIEKYDCKVYATDYDVTQHRARVDLMIVPKSVLYQIFLTISV